MGCNLVSSFHPMTSQTLPTTPGSFPFHPLVSQTLSTTSDPFSLSVRFRNLRSRAKRLGGSLSSGPGLTTFLKWLRAGLAALSIASARFFALLSSLCAVSSPASALRYCSRHFSISAIHFVRRELGLSMAFGPGRSVRILTPRWARWL